MLYILFFFLDFISFMILKKWLIFSLLGYFIASQFNKKNKFIYSFKLFYLPLFFLLIQDNFINGRLGIGLIYIIPIIFFSEKVRNWFSPPFTFFCYFFLIFSIILQSFLIKKWLLGQNIELYSTTLKIFINMIIEYLILLGMRGNRSLFKT